MKTIYLHIGFHKTGSTTLQTFLYQHEKSLLDQGLYIPLACRQRRSSIIHSNLSWDLLGSNSFDASLGTAEDLRHEVQNCNAEKILITDEGLSRIRTPQTLLNLFPGMACHVIAYTRDPHSAAASFYSETLKFGSSKPFSLWLQSGNREFADHNRLLERWRRSDANLSSTGLDEPDVKSGGLVSHFCKQVGVAPPEANASNSNSRISYQEAIALYYCNGILELLADEIPPAQRVKLHDRIRRLIRKEMKESLIPYGLTESQMDMLEEAFGPAKVRVFGSDADFKLPLEVCDRIRAIVKNKIFDEILQKRAAGLETFQPSPRP